MALFKKKLTPIEVAKLYLQTKESVKAFEKLATSENGEVKEVAIQGIEDIRKEIKKLAKEVRRTKKDVIANRDSDEDMLLDNFADYEEDLLLMDTLGLDTRELQNILEDYEKVFSGEIEKARSFQNDKEEENEYVYSNNAINRARNKEYKEIATYSLSERKPILKDSDFHKAGMVASALISISNPILGATLMTTNLVAEQQRKQERER